MIPILYAAWATILYIPFMSLFLNPTMFFSFFQAKHQATLPAVHQVNYPELGGRFSYGVASLPPGMPSHIACVCSYPDSPSCAVEHPAPSPSFDVQCPSVDAVPSSSNTIISTLYAFATEQTKKTGCSFALFVGLVAMASLLFCISIFPSYSRSQTHDKGRTNASAPLPIISEYLQKAPSVIDVILAQIPDQGHVQKSVSLAPVAIDRLLDEYAESHVGAVVPVSNDKVYPASSPDALACDHFEVPSPTTSSSNSGGSDQCRCFNLSNTPPHTCAFTVFTPVSPTTSHYFSPLLSISPAMKITPCETPVLDLPDLGLPPSSEFVSSANLASLLKGDTSLIPGHWRPTPIIQRHLAKAPRTVAVGSESDTSITDVLGPWLSHNLQARDKHDSDLASSASPLAEAVRPGNSPVDPAIGSDGRTFDQATSYGSEDMSLCSGSTNNNSFAGARFEPCDNNLQRSPSCDISQPPTPDIEAAIDRSSLILLIAPFTLPSPVFSGHHQAVDPVEGLCASLEDLTLASLPDDQDREEEIFVTVSATDGVGQQCSPSRACMAPQDVASNDPEEVGAESIKASEDASGLSFDEPSKEVVDSLEDMSLESANSSRSFQELAFGHSRHAESFEESSLEAASGIGLSAQNLPLSFQGSMDYGDMSLETVSAHSVCELVALGLRTSVLDRILEATGSGDPTLLLPCNREPSDVASNVEVEEPAPTIASPSSSLAHISTYAPLADAGPPVVIELAPPQGLSFPSDPQPPHEACHQSWDVDELERAAVSDGDVYDRLFLGVGGGDLADSDCMPVQSDAVDRSPLLPHHDEESPSIVGVPSGDSGVEIVITVDDQALMFSPRLDLSKDEFTTVPQLLVTSTGGVVIETSSSLSCNPPESTSSEASSLPLSTEPSIVGEECLYMDEAQAVSEALDLEPLSESYFGLHRLDLSPPAFPETDVEASGSVVMDLKHLPSIQEFPEPNTTPPFAPHLLLTTPVGEIADLTPSLSSNRAGSFELHPLPVSESDGLGAGVDDVLLVEPCDDYSLADPAEEQDILDSSDAECAFPSRSGSDEEESDVYYDTDTECEGQGGLARRWSDEALSEPDVSYFSPKEDNTDGENMSESGTEDDEDEDEESTIPTHINHEQGDPAEVGGHFNGLTAGIWANVADDTAERLALPRFTGLDFDSVDSFWDNPTRTDSPSTPNSSPSSSSSTPPSPILTTAPSLFLRHNPNQFTHNPRRRSQSVSPNTSCITVDDLPVPSASGYVIPACRSPSDRIPMGGVWVSRHPLGPVGHDGEERAWQPRKRVAPAVAIERGDLGRKGEADFEGVVTKYEFNGGQIILAKERLSDANEGDEVGIIVSAASSDTVDVEGGEAVIQGRKTGTRNERLSASRVDSVSPAVQRQPSLSLGAVVAKALGWSRRD
ncbi:hypothetical protein JAAARDRAFT_194960 [Jaapia argillacea MUCL 33604]|uniref:Uncharacterized protein n=1 Tax=Jaapia argillacea MUCL 33604 TaxID=933084 RepID=A0A067PND4_9AGAM|nr:hypothetical protein JAAARDRAFT_194960 [Jaapia argillacea MUCL 33604]